jgi:hypothetical protein
MRNALKKGHGPFGPKHRVFTGDFLDLARSLLHPLDGRL